MPVLLIVCLGFAVSNAGAAYNTPSKVPIQGRLTNVSTGVALSGPYNFTFRVYDAATLGTKLWGENQSLIVDSGGLWSTFLGNNTPLDMNFSEDTYIEIEINHDGDPLPRVQLATVPYSKRTDIAANLSCVDCIGGAEINESTLSGVNAAQLGGQASGYYLNTSASFGGDVSGTYGSLEVNASKIDTGILNRSYIEDAYLLNTGDNATGNYSFDSDTLYVDSSNHRIGIGTNTPTYKLEVLGGVNVTGNLTTPLVCLNGDCRSTWPTGSGISSAGGWVNTSSETYSSLDVNLSNKFFFNSSSGYVGIGTTNPFAPLSVGSASQFQVSSTGAVTAASINGNNITAGTGALTLGAGKTFNASNTLTLTATDGATLAIGSGGTLGTGAYATIGNYAPLASPTFTGTVTMPSPFTLGATSVTANGTELNYVVGVTSAIQTQLNAKAPTASPTFTGSVTMPGTGIWNTSGNVGIGTTAPVGKLHVYESNGTGHLLHLRGDSGTRAADTAGLRLIDLRPTTDNHGWSANLMVQGGNTVNQTAPLVYTYSYAASPQTGLYMDHNGMGPAIDIAVAGGYGLIVRQGNVGIGTAAPTEKLNVNGSLRVDNAVGSALLYVNASNGYIGIGTTAPRSQLHVQKDGRTSIMISAPNNASGAVGDYTISLNRGETPLNNNTSQQIISWAWSFRTDAFGLNQPGSLILYRDTAFTETGSSGSNWPIGFKPNLDTIINGNVGIGTASPVSPLDVSGTTSNTTWARFGKTSGTSSFGDWAGIDFLMTNQVDQFNGNPAARIAGYLESAGNNFGLSFWTGASVYAGQFTEKMRITSAGNVGIGTTVPKTALQVGSRTGLFDVGGTYSYLAKNAYKDGTWKRITSDYATLIGIGDASGDMYFSVAGTGVADSAITFTDALVIKNSGNVGIGTTSPSYQLQLSTNSAGKPGGGSWTDSSDIRLKKNVSEITGALDRLTMLQGVNYEWINPEEHGNLTGVQAGLIAQDVEKVFPEWVGEINSSGKDSDLADGGNVKTLQLPYGFNAYVVEAMKELKAEKDAEIGQLKAEKDSEIGQLRAENSQIKRENEALKRAVCEINPTAEICAGM